MTTVKEMCEEILKADFLEGKNGKKPTTAEDICNEDICNYSPTGELSKVFEWYEIAKILNSVKSIEEDK